RQRLDLGHARRHSRQGGVSYRPIHFAAPLPDRRADSSEWGVDHAGRNDGPVERRGAIGIQTALSKVQHPEFWTEFALEWLAKLRDDFFRVIHCIILPTLCPSDASFCTSR